MNQFNTWYKMQPPAIRALLTTNVVIYILWFLLFQHFGFTRNLALEHLSLQADLKTLVFQPWQLITYNFLHLGTDFGGLLHITFNMLWLVWIGRDYEELHGSHRLFSIYIIGGIGGGILTIILHELFPGFSRFGGPVYGASASVLAIMMTVAILHPYKNVGLLFLGNVRLLYIVLGFLVIDPFISSDSSMSAHWGGVLFGFLFAKAESSGVDLSSWARYFFQPRTKSRRAPAGEDEGMLKKMERWLASRNSPKAAPERPARERERTWRRAEVDVEIQEPSSENEVDRILDKISAEGYEALTAEEKQILYEASRR